MTTEKTRSPLAQAEKLAQEVVALLAPACERIEIGGSIRRRRPDVGDIEIIAIPKIWAREDGPRDLWGEPILDEPMDQLGPLCYLGISEGWLADRLDRADRRAFGMRFKRLSFHGFALDVFSVLPPAQWGVILAIRTGPADYSHQLVTPRTGGFTDAAGLRRIGLMPPQYRVRDGAVIYAADDGRHRYVEVAEEEDLFRLWGIGWRPPEERR